MINNVLKIFFFCCLSSCVAKKEKITTQTSCPKDGTCIFQKYEDYSLEIIEDYAKSINYKMNKIQGKTILYYKYQRNSNPNHQDGHYIEEIIFELDNSIFDKSFKNRRSDKALFGVFCYCKGKAGYYHSENKMTISFDKKTEVITIHLDQIVEGQVLININESAHFNN